MKLLSNTETELKKLLPIKKHVFVRNKPKNMRETSVVKLKLAAETFYVHSFAALLY